MSADKSDDDGVSISRRDLVKAVGSIAGIAAASNVAVDADVEDFWTDNAQHYVGDEYGEYGASDVIHTTCGQCNSFCPVKVRLADTSGTGEYSSLIRKLAGNPYSFLTTEPFGQVPYNSDPEDVAMGDLAGSGLAAPASGKQSRGNRLSRRSSTATTTSVIPACARCGRMPPKRRS